MTLITLMERQKNIRIFVVFDWFLKIILGLGFILSGLHKIPGVKFTTLPIENPVGLSLKAGT